MHEQQIPANEVWKGIWADMTVTWIMGGTYSFEKAMAHLCLSTL